VALADYQETYVCDYEYVDVDVLSTTCSYGGNLFGGYPYLQNKYFTRYQSYDGHITCPSSLYVSTYEWVYVYNNGWKWEWILFNGWLNLTSQSHFTNTESVLQEVPGSCRWEEYDHEDNCTRKGCTIEP